MNKRRNIVAVMAGVLCIPVMVCAWIGDVHDPGVGAGGPDIADFYGPTEEGSFPPADPRIDEIVEKLEELYEELKQAMQEALRDALMQEIGRHGSPTMSPGEPTMKRVYQFMATSLPYGVGGSYGVVRYKVRFPMSCSHLLHIYGIYDVKKYGEMWHGGMKWNKCKYKMVHYQTYERLQGIAAQTEWYEYVGSE